MNEAGKITVNARKYDRRIRKTWQCDFVEQRDVMIVLLGVFDEDIQHAGLGSINRGTLSYEYYWLDRPYNIFRFHEPGGAFRSFYCNVSLPATFADGVLDYVDLDIDILVDRDMNYEIVDRDDFEINREKYGYPAEILSLAEASVSELEGLIERREFPFDRIEA